LSELEISHARLSAYASHIEELTALSERQNIARNLHDTLIQSVAGLLMQLEVVQSQLQNQRTARAQEVLEDALLSTRDALADARSTLSDLRNEQIRPDDLIEIVQEEIARFSARTNLPCESSLELLSDIPGPGCHHVLRVISEGLANIARHAHAQKAWIYVMNNGEELTVEIGDNGQGFDVGDDRVQDGHYGLLGLKERARMLGGELEIISPKGEGTVLRLHIPLLVEPQR
jgi:NarL family two-component system sensor histidine kinase YdfH